MSFFSCLLKGDNTKLATFYGIMLSPDKFCFFPKFCSTKADDHDGELLLWVL